MTEIVVRNVNSAFSELFWKLKVLDLQPEPTRNGPALVFPEPVITTYNCPLERVLFHAGRDCNPVFHLLESIWILAGRRDVAFLQQFNSKIGQYSDDGKNFNAAYGYRLRHHFGRDQLVEVIQQLRKDPGTRQAVMQIWDPVDLTKKTKDKACNMEVVFDNRGGRLNMSVLNRSNDAWWGAYGANAVHFSILQEFVACAVGLRVGVYRQISNNLHLYTELYNAKQYLVLPPTAESYDHYSSGQVRPSPLMLNGEYRSFLEDCERFCNDPFDTEAEYAHPFIKHVAHPMAMISRVRKIGAGDGRGYAAKVRSEDWRRAALEWIDRRERLKQSA